MKMKPGKQGFKFFLNNILVTSTMLFIFRLEALSCKFPTWKDLYANILVIIAGSLDGCVRRLLAWKEAIENKGLRVKSGKD